MNLSELKNKKIAIWGFGVEGQACAAYLSKQGIAFQILCKASEAIDKYDCINSEVNQELLDTFDCIIKSPGISPYTSLLKQAKASITSPTALWFANEKKCPVIVITGTKGKSTTASMLAEVLSKIGKSVNLVGNIGTALISSHSDYDYLVLEASSFQIYDGEIKADIVVVTNLFEEHLDWHAGIDNYFKDKLKVLNQAKVKIINADNQILNERVKDENVIYFNDKNGFYVQQQQLFYQDKPVLNLSQVKLIGEHNLQNIGAVLSVCQQLGLSMQLCIDVIKNFKPLAHRLQDLGKIGEHCAINDSISTTPIATLAAMQTVDQSITTLLIGGFDRGNNWMDFAKELVKNPPNLLILSGQNGKIIYDCLLNIKPQFRFEICDTLADAIDYARKNTEKDGIILLSPGAPSFDQFDSYIKRGEFFAEKLKSYEK
jgi:UDP-N-acetylmuramoylalanine--D-glutamate ligase